MKGKVQSELQLKTQLEDYGTWEAQTYLKATQIHKRNIHFSITLRVYV